jgi:hypothetical protein
MEYVPPHSKDFKEKSSIPYGKPRGFFISLRVTTEGFHVNGCRAVLLLTAAFSMPTVFFSFFDTVLAAYTGHAANA